MNKTAHRFYLAILVIVILSTLTFLVLMGINYYRIPMEERFFHDDHGLLKPSGIIGHGYGIIGSLMILFGVFSYMARKRIKWMHRLGFLKHWLEFHIFLCVLGPLLVLFHTSFKFGGIVAISFWSMVAVVLSGVIGRFIYLQIPRTLEGSVVSVSELSLQQQTIEQLAALQKDQAKTLYDRLMKLLNQAQTQRQKAFLARVIGRFFSDGRLYRKGKSIIVDLGISGQQKKQAKHFLRKEIKTRRKIDQLTTMQNLLRYWHVAHLPFALIMLLIMVLHVAITLIFGYKWIF